YAGPPRLSPVEGERSPSPAVFSAAKNCGEARKLLCVRLGEKGGTMHVYAGPPRLSPVEGERSPSPVANLDI
ncbi:MAG: hypothetical protein AAB355_00630, partial [Patescibacteria group bacterium]